MVRVVAILVISCLIIVGSYYLARTPYGGTPEQAANAYLNAVTSSYSIVDEKKDLSDNSSDYTRIIVTANCQYNWRGSNQGRKDGINTYFFDTTRSDRGWHVTAANSGP
jgi:archaellum component FlaF (FlaF/FlaG flagellin family)